MADITVADVRNAVKDRLLKRFSAVDYDPVEVDFTRRAVLLDMLPVTPRRIAPLITEITARMQLTVSVDRDAFGRSSRETLLTEQEAVMALFASGVLNVGSRAVRVSVSSAGDDGEVAVIDLTATYTVAASWTPAPVGVITDATATIKEV